MKFTYEGWVYCQPAASYHSRNANIIDGFAYDVYGFEAPGAVGRATVTIELPDDFDPRGPAVEALQKEKKELMAKFQARITEIDAQINKFTALEMA